MFDQGDAANMETYDVLIAGGGYAGMMCALRLAGLTRGRGLQIALINPRPRFVERLRLHEGLVVDGDPGLRSFALAPFLAKRGIAFIEGSIVAIDEEAGTADVAVTDGAHRKVGFSRLVLATGSSSDRSRIPGADAHAHVLEHDGHRNVHALRALLKQHATPKVLVVGAGPTGVEVAAEIAGKPGARVTLIGHAPFGAFTTPPVARKVRGELERSGVRLFEAIEVKRLHTRNAETSEGSIAFDLCVVCAGFVCDPVPDLEADPAGRLKVDPFLRSTRNARIYAAGDLAVTGAVPGAPPRMSAFYALCTGAHAARNIAREFSGKALIRFGFWTYGQAFGLGRHAVGFASFPCDTPLPPYYSGRVGYHLRRFFVWLLFRLLKVEQVWPGLPFYLRPWRGGRRTSTRIGLDEPA